MKWPDDVEKDLKKMKVKGWIEKMRSREQWRLVVEETKAHPGLQRRVVGRWAGSYRKRDFEHLLSLTDSFTWEELPTIDPNTGYVTRAGYIPIIQKLTKILPTFILGFHIIQSTFRVVLYHDMVLTSWYPFDTSESPVYEIVNLTQVIASIIPICMFFGFQSLYATLTCVACSQLEKLRAALLDIRQTHVTAERDCGAQADLLEAHGQARASEELYVKEMEDTVNIPNCGLFLILLSGMCFGAMSAITAESVRDAAWGCDWVGTPVPFQRCLAFIIATANKEFTLTAGKFVPVSNKTMINLSMTVYAKLPSVSVDRLLLPQSEDVFARSEAGIVGSDLFPVRHELKIFMKKFRLLMGTLLHVWMYTSLRYRKREVQNLLNLTNSFIWEDLPTRDPDSGNLTTTGYMPIIERLTIYVSTGAFLFHGVQSSARIVLNHDMVLTTWYPFDATVSPVYEIANLTQGIASIFHIAINAAFTSLYATLVCVACSQLEKLRAALLDIGQTHVTAERDSGTQADLLEAQGQARASEELFRHMQKQLNNCIRHHQEIKRLPNLSSRSMILGYIQTLIDMVSQSISIFMFLLQMKDRNIDADQGA
ncbi:hypothetical protein B7P43_G08636 [Cryptotermes secundus]|uniref:Odorant receptor n=1 Tax=Cryptotermes secundus TaxID=105785 RepID=A0A2J7Q5Z8_9NEOP|nr:hypothetical protein B7P43_G08636 [Cryptotermes secundus]